MPFKDIDWNKVAKQTQVSYNIGRENAIINAQAEGNVPKYEWLTGKKLVERDPIAEAIKLDKKSREQQPIISKLTEISDKTITPKALTTIMRDIPAIDYARVTEPLALPSTKPQHRRSKSDPIIINMNEGIDPTIIAKYDFKMPYDIAKEVSSSESKMVEFEAQKKNLEHEIKTIASRSRRDPSLRQDLHNLRQLNKAYNTIRQNKEMIKKPTSSSTSTSTSTGKGVKNRIYYTNPKELTQRLTVLLGEVQAGNNSKHIKNEIADISHHMYKKKLIKKKEYRNILSSM